MSAIRVNSAVSHSTILEEEMRQVRAKFRCLSITKKWDHSVVAELGAVMNKKGDNFEENRSFWDCTPTGKVELVYHDECELEVGAYYYVDLVETEDESAWHLNYVRLSDNGQGDVGFSWWRKMPEGWNHKQPMLPGMHRGSFEMAIEGTKTKALEAFQKPGSRWKVSFTFASPSDD
jgi:hypothetical protein